MWQKLGKFVLKQRIPLLVILFAVTGVMGYYASKVKLSYEFTRAIPVDNPKYKEYIAFKQRFGDDGNLLVVGIKTSKLFDLATFKAYIQLHQSLKKIRNVEDVLSVPYTISLQKDSLSDKLSVARIFRDSISSQAELDSERKVFENLPFYHSLLWNPDSLSYLIGVRINKDTLNSPKRSKIVAAIADAAKEFERSTNIETHLSGLPLIRTVVADRLQQEMRFFLLGSILLSAFILLIFFRSVSNMLLSLLVVIFGVIWSLGILYLCGYKITLLTALTPPLVVVIGIPNCIYFINKYHTSFLKTGDKYNSLVDMVSKMGVVTLFCNITAAIGFAVFALTQSAILKEFGVVAGISIMLIFVISFILLPSVLSFLPVPKASETKYLNNRLITSFLLKIEDWVIGHKKMVYGVTLVLVGVAIAGIFKLKTVGFIVDDLPKTDKIYTDLKFFEKNFKGVMPLEIVVDTKRPNGLRKPGVFERVDTLSTFIAGLAETNRPLSIAEGFKFFYQGFSQGDSSAYVFPNEKIVEELMRKLKPGTDSAKKDNLTKMLLTFMDSGRQRTRISVAMADVGTQRLPHIIDTIKARANLIFNGKDSLEIKDTAGTKYNITITGTSSTFLEGSSFIIKGLLDSIFWAFLLISLCMLYLFRSFRILLCSLIPNIIPLVITAGAMGWVGVPLKPSTVLVFSVALGIAIDVTIRFLVNYKQELPDWNNDVNSTVRETIKHTGLSIVYTSLVLIAGFIIFCFSGFGGTKALGWLTSVTLLTATLTNLVLLPVLLLWVAPQKKNSPGK